VIAISGDAASGTIEGLRPDTLPDSVPFFDLSAQHRALETELARAMSEVVLSGRCVLGPVVEALEQELARWLDVPHVVATASGTDALEIALRALDLPAGTEVATSPFTFVATASSIVRAGLRPVFADIDPDSWCLSPSAVESVLGPRIGALLPVHLFGRMADLPALRSICERRGIELIEDAAQAFGSAIDGRASGTWGRAGCFSFYPTKNLGAAGDAGAITTSDTRLAERARRLRGHGDAGRFRHVELGGTNRMDALQAAVLRAKLPYARRWIASRGAIADLYRRELAGTDFLLPASPRPGEDVAWNLFCIRHPRRDAVRDHLRRCGIGSEVYYPTPLHLQPCFEGLGYTRGRFPVAEQLAETILALPLYPELGLDRVGHVVHALREFDRGVSRGEA